MQKTYEGILLKSFIEFEHEKIKIEGNLPSTWNLEFD